MWTFKKSQDFEIVSFLKALADRVQSGIERNFPKFRCDICGKEIVINLQERKADGRVSFLIRLEEDPHGSKRVTKDIKSFRILCRRCDEILSEEQKDYRGWEYSSRGLSFYLFETQENLNNLETYWKFKELMGLNPVTYEDKVKIERFLAKTLTYRTVLVEELLSILDEIRRFQEDLPSS